MKQIGVIFGIMLAFTVLINPVFAITPLDRVDITNPRLENTVGTKISDQVNVNQQVQISADIKNNQGKSQDFYYLIQVKTQNGVVVSFQWIKGKLDPGQIFKTALSWTPKVSNEYTAEIFVWDITVDSKTKTWQVDPLAEHVILKITS
ncbi:hypothetical protein EMGBD3_10200 [Nitrosarchaeum sp.]|nr:hypothetical protein EMGBD3_10200 [Nitrosarchaeum sp.]